MFSILFVPFFFFLIIAIVIIICFSKEFKHFSPGTGYGAFTGKEGGDSYQPEKKAQTKTAVVEMSVPTMAALDKHIYD